MGGRKEHRELVKYIVLMVVIGVGVFGGFQLLKVYLGTPTPFRVVSTSPSSMEPSLHYGDLVIIKNVPWYEIGVGDIIVFDAYNWYFSAGETPSQIPLIPVIHRVYNVTFENGQIYYYTWGDNRLTNPQPDPAPTPYWMVHGKVIFAIPKLGLLLLFLQEGGYILLIIVLVLLVVAMAMKGLRELKEEVPENGDGDSKIIKNPGFNLMIEARWCRVLKAQSGQASGALDPGTPGDHGGFRIWAGLPIPHLYFFHSKVYSGIFFLSNILPEVRNEESFYPKG